MAEQILNPVFFYPTSQALCTGPPLSLPDQSLCEDRVTSWVVTLKDHTHGASKSTQHIDGGWPVLSPDNFTPVHARNPWWSGFLGPTPLPSSSRTRGWEAFCLPFSPLWRINTSPWQPQRGEFVLLKTWLVFKDTHEFRGMPDFAINTHIHTQTENRRKSVTSSFSVQKTWAKAVKTSCGVFTSMFPRMWKPQDHQEWCIPNDGGWRAKLSRITFLNKRRVVWPGHGWSH